MQEMNKIMLIADSFECRRAFYKILQEIDKEIQLIPFSSGRSALNYFSQPGCEIPRCIFLDTLMPDMNGFQTLRLLKENQHLRKIPVIMCASANPGLYIDIAHTLGAYTCIRKTLDFTNAIAQIRELLITTENAC
jgi:CheY-like chemotaxis protein